MGCGTGTLKSCLGLISLFFWVCAVVLIVIGSLIMYDYGRIEELGKATDILVPSVILIGAGVFLFIVGMLGCVGGMKGNKAALTVFFILVLIIMVGEVAAVACGYYYKSELHGKLTGKVHEMVKKCANGSRVDCDELDFLQKKFECCGADTYQDWYNSSSSNYSIPQSCCKVVDCITPPKGANSTIVDNTIYTKGCSDKAEDQLEQYFSWIFVGTIIIVVLQVLGMVATCIMLFRSRETPYLSLDSQGYRV